MYFFYICKCKYQAILIHVKELSRFLFAFFRKGGGVRKSIKSIQYFCKRYLSIHLFDENKIFFFYQKYTNQKESSFQNLFGLLYFSYVFIEMTYIEY